MWFVQPMPATPLTITDPLKGSWNTTFEGVTVKCQRVGPKGSGLNEQEGRVNLIAFSKQLRNLVNVLDNCLVNRRYLLQSV